jgi:hypothetical protein
MYVCHSSNVFGGMVRRNPPTFDVVANRVVRYPDTETKTNHDIPMITQIIAEAARATLAGTMPFPSLASLVVVAKIEWKGHLLL